MISRAILNLNGYRVGQEDRNQSRSRLHVWRVKKSASASSNIGPMISSSTAVWSDGVMLSDMISEITVSPELRSYDAKSHSKAKEKAHV